MTGNRPDHDAGEGGGPEHGAWTERWYRVMLLGYPRPYRQRHGAELLGTLLEAHPSRRLPSLRESAGLLDAGLLARLRGRLEQAPAWADGVQLGVLLLALMQAGSVLGRVSTVQQPQLPVLLPSLLLVVALLLGRMGTAALLATVTAVTVTRQALMLSGGTGYFGVSLTARVVEVPGSSGLGFWLSASVWQFWAIVVGSAVLALNLRGRGPLPRRSWWWLTVPLLEAAYSSYSRSLMPAAPLPDPGHLILPGSVAALSVLPLVAAVVLLLLALRATVGIGDARWAVAAGVYLVPAGVYAAALVCTRPSDIVTLDGYLPTVVLAAACAVVLLRRASRRAAGRAAR